MIIKQILKDMVEIPAGEFKMGSLGKCYEEQPVHLVSLKAFSIGKYPVTQAQYEAVMDTNPSKTKGESRPVENISWYDAQEFCQKLTELAGESKTKFKLPSEAQWEYACRAGSDGKWCFGYDESQLREYAWYTENSDKQTHPVGEKKSNAFGLYDMYGNVWEWCKDHWHYGYNGAPTEGSSWVDEGANTRRFRVMRGGSWDLNVDYCRSTCRFAYCPEYHSNNLGFRICSEERK